MSSVPEAPVRVTVVMTHPIQYYSPWFRWIAAHCPALDLTVLYAAVPTPEEQGRAFCLAFEWDAPLLDGYRSVVCSGAGGGRRFEDDAFWGVDVPGIGRRIAGTAPDVVLIAGWHSAVQVRALLACRVRGIPAVYRGDTTLGNGPSGWRRLPWAVRTWGLLRLFDGWLAVGVRATEYLRAFGVPDDRIARSPHCVDHDTFARQADGARAGGGREAWRAQLGIDPEAFAVLYVGRVYPHKRPLDAVRAVAVLAPGAVLVVSGDGPQLAEVRAEAARLGVRLETPGFVNQRDLPGLYAACDVLVLPSVHETWGLVVNEALACGLPVVVSHTVSAGVDLVQEGVSGHRVAVGDTAAIARALGQVRDGRGEGRYSVEACRQALARHGFAEATAGLLTLARAVASRRRAGRPFVVS